MRQLRTTYQLRDNISSTLKNHGNTVLQKESSNSPESKLKVTEYCYLIDREFKILVIKKLSELQENSEKQFGKLRNKNNEQKEYFTKEIETQNNNNNQTELDLKDSIDEMKNH